MKVGISRRTFLKGAAVSTVAAAGAAALSSCASGEAADNADADVPERSWEAEYDIVVVGAGAAGLASALTVAAEGNGATCLIIEKEATPNGNSPYCAGNFLYTDDFDTMKQYLSGLIGGATPDDVITAFCQGLTEIPDWLASTGAKEGDLGALFPPGSEDYFGEYPEIPGGNSCGIMRFTGEAGGATHIHTYLLDAAKEADSITYMPSTPLDELIQDGSTGAIIGVVAKGKNYRANRGVVMCTGGYESSPDMLLDYMGVSGAKALAGGANTGDGHRACMKVGADFWHMYGGACFWMASRNLDNSKFLSTVWNFDNKQYGITVGANGRRFYQDWDGCYILPDSKGPQFATYEESEESLKFKVGYRHAITQFGANWTHLPLPEKAWYIFDSEGLAQGAIPAELSSDPVDEGWALTADSIGELAPMIDVPAGELVDSVDAWNAFCDNGADPAFYRPTSSLKKIVAPPFYAMLCAPTVLNTDGGPRRSAQAEILDPYGNPIPRLYSAGEFGSIWGHLYQGAGNIAECLVFGKIAARSALSNG